MNIEDIRQDQYIDGLSPGEVAKVLYVAPAGTDAVRVVYETPSLGVRDRQVFRSDAAGMRIADTLVPWSFSSPGKEFALALEAFRMAPRIGISKGKWNFPADWEAQDKALDAEIAKDFYADSL